MTATPLVCCVMATSAGRRRFIPHAVDYFLRQDYENKRLIVLSDGEHDVRDAVAEDTRIRYEHTQQQLVYGAKMNALFDLVPKGALVAIWDDDDWHAPWRLSYEAAILMRSDAPRVGTQELLVWDWSTSLLHIVVANLNPVFACHGTLLLERSVWETSPYPEIGEGADAQWQFRSSTPLAICKLFNFYVYMQNHGTNATHVPLDDDNRLEGWRLWDVLGSDAGNYL